MKTIKHNINFLLLVTMLLTLISSNSCNLLLSKARVKVVKNDCIPGVGLTNGEMDYGVNVKLKVRNLGDNGVVKIETLISTSEGTWNKSQELDFNKDEVKDLTYFFAEPSINVSNVQCKIKVSPEAK